MSYIIGIDPGLSGAIAIIYAEDNCLEVFDMPVMSIKVGSKTKDRLSAELLREILVPFAFGSKAIIEQVGAMPGQGVSSTFAFGEAFGIAKGVLAGLGIPTTTVVPAKWKKDIGLNAGKDGSRQKACQLWPQYSQNFARVKDHNRAEAALIAEWYRRQLK